MDENILQPLEGAEEDEELELSEEQANRNAEIYNAAHEFCKVLADDPNFGWDMAAIGAIVDYAAERLTRAGIKVRFPAVVTEDDGTQYITEYYE